MDTYTITIDGGTTNTRCILWNSSRQRIDEQKREVGVRNTAIDGCLKTILLLTITSIILLPAV